MPDEPTDRYRFIGCEIIYREACHLAATAARMVDVEFLRKGLHDLETPDMVAAVQERIDAVDEGLYRAVLLGYARCNDGLVGVEARGIPVVIPRAHDCITLLFGSRGAYRRRFDEHPGTYYYSTGWAERNLSGDEAEQPAYGKRGVMARLGLTETYEQMVAKYGKDNADYIVASLGDWRKNYTHLLYLEMGVCDERGFIEAARRHAERESWQFERRPGCWDLLEKLFDGRWDEDFVVVPPGKRIVARNDETVLDFE